MLSFSKSTIAGIADKPILVVARNKAGTFFDAIEAGAVFKSYPDAEIIATFPVNKKLKEGEHDSPPKGHPQSRSDYASEKYYMFPISSKDYTEKAVQLFSRHKWHPDEDKHKVARKIMAAAKKFGVKVDPDSPVARAAKD